MKKHVLILLLCLAISSCQENNGEILPSEEFVPAFIVDTNLAQLAKRVSVSNQVAFDVKDDQTNLTYNKVADVSPNQVNGHILSATGVAYLDDLVYVTYHVRGDVYGGEILTFDVSSPSQPQLISSLVDEFADYNDIMMGQFSSNVWVAGARDIYNSGYENTDGAIATKIGLNNDKTPKNVASWEIPLLSYSASSITRVQPPAGASNGRIFITSGSKGGLEVVRGNDENEIFHSRQTDNAKHFDYYNEQGVFLRGIDGSSSAIDVYALDDSFAFSTYNIPYDVTYLGKNGIDVTDGFAFLAMGDDGLIKVSTTDGTIAATYNSNGNGDANAVMVDGDYVYLANGSDGLIILRTSDLSFVANYKYDGSCNYVDIKGDLLFLANGSTGGLIILEKTSGSS